MLLSAEPLVMPFIVPSALPLALAFARLVAMVESLRDSAKESRYWINPSLGYVLLQDKSVEKDSNIKKT